jgi:hypothetical protein
VVEACRDGRVLARAAISAASPTAPAGANFSPTILWSKSGAVIQWPSLGNLHVACYEIAVSPPSGGAPRPFESLGKIPAMRLGMHRVPAALVTGKSIYRITPIDQSGKKFAPVEVLLKWPNDERAEVVLDRVIEDASANGKVLVEGASATFTGAGYLETPHDELMSLETGGSLAFEFRADRLDGMPVLLSHGEWQRDGWFVRILDRRLMIRTTGGDVIGPEVQPGRWYSVRWEYDGARSNFYLDGKNLAPDQTLVVSPCRRMLRIGQYERVEPSYAFHGGIRHLVIRGWMQRSAAAVTFDFSGPPPWVERDGKVTLKSTRAAGRPTLQLRIGGQGDSRFNSAWIRQQAIDIELAPILSFRLRSTSTEPLALLLQRMSDTDRWWAINLVGTQTGYPSLANLTERKLNDGKWHDVSLDLRRILAGQWEPGQASQIKNLIIGSWENPSHPILVEFQAFAFGSGGSKKS